MRQNGSVLAVELSQYFSLIHTWNRAEVKILGNDSALFKFWWYLGEPRRLMEYRYLKELLPDQSRTDHLAKF